MAWRISSRVMCTLLLKMENLTASNTCVRHPESLSTIIMLTENTVVDAGASCIRGLCGVPTTPTGLLRTPAQKKPQVLDLGYRLPSSRARESYTPHDVYAYLRELGGGRDGSRGEG